MEKNVYISIKGNQEVEGEKDCLELVTEGTYSKEDDKYYISYKESEMTGYANSSTTLKIDKDNIVTLVRSGEANTQMIFEKGRRHVGHYETPMGSLTIGVSTRDVDIDIDESGGNIAIDYVLDINNSAFTKSDLRLSIRESV